MKKYLVILLLIFIYGCNHTCEDFIKNFTLVDSLNIKNEALADVNYYSFHFVNDNSDSLLTFRKDKNIIVLDLKTNNLKYEISLDNLDSLVYLDHLYYNDDSIFICSVLKQKEMFILLINNKGEINKRWDLNKFALQVPDSYFFIASRQDHPMEFRRNLLYFQASYHIKPGTVIESRIPIEMLLDLKTGSALQIGDLPLEYKEGNFYGNQQWEYSRVINRRGELVFSFPISHNLYIYDKNGDLMRTVDCQSHYINNIDSIGKDNYTDLSAIIDAFTYHSQYGDLVYDKYRNIYYRVVLHKLDKFNDQGKINDHRKREWSILILDENMKKIKEVLMPVNKFWKRLVVTKQGLMLKLVNNDLKNDYEIYSFQLCTD